MNENLIFMLTFAASAAAPGPEVAMLLSRTFAGGLLRSMPFLSGIIAGKLLMLTAALVGLAALVQVLGPFLTSLKWVGAAYVLYLGIKKFVLAGKQLAVEANSKPIHLLTDVGVGLSLTLSNPLAIVFYLALLPGVIGPAGVGFSRYLLLVGMVIGVMFLVGLAYGLLAELARRLLTSEKSKTTVDRVSGLMLVGAALLVALH